MSFLELKNWPFLFIGIILCFALAISREITELQKFRHQIITLKQERPLSSDLMKQAIIQTLTKNHYCGFQENNFVVIEFKREMKMTLWFTPLVETNRRYYPPQFRPTAFGHFSLSKNRLHLEHTLFGYPKVENFIAQDGPSSVFQLLKNNNVIFSPELCTIAASL